MVRLGLSMNLTLLKPCITYKVLSTQERWVKFVCLSLSFPWLQQGHLRQSLPTLTQMTFWAECASRQHFEQCASLQKWCRSVELPSRRGSARRVVGLKHHAALPLHHVRQGPCQLCLHWHLLGSFPILLQLLPSAQPIMGRSQHFSSWIQIYVTGEGQQRLWDSEDLNI